MGETLSDLAEKQARMVEIEQATLELQQDFKYPVDSFGRPMLLNHLHPDLVPTLVYHLIRLGYRKDPEKAFVKQRKIIGAPYADLVKYVPLDEPDEPIYVNTPPADVKPWSVKPVVNIIDEKRPQ